VPGTSLRPIRKCLPKIGASRPGVLEPLSAAPCRPRALPCRSLCGPRDPKTKPPARPGTGRRTRPRVGHRQSVLSDSPYRSRPSPGVPIDPDKPPRTRPQSSRRPAHQPAHRAPDGPHLADQHRQPRSTAPRPADPAQRFRSPLAHRTRPAPGRDPGRGALRPTRPQNFWTEQKRRALLTPSPGLYEAPAVDLVPFPTPTPSAPVLPHAPHPPRSGLTRRTPFGRWVGLQPDKPPSAGSSAFRPTNPQSAGGSGFSPTNPRRPVARPSARHTPSRPVGRASARQTPVGPHLELDPDQPWRSCAPRPAPRTPKRKSEQQSRLPTAPPEHPTASAWYAYQRIPLVLTGIAPWRTLDGAEHGCSRGPARKPPTL
jgi:hypothetical protein